MDREEKAERKPNGKPGRGRSAHKTDTKRVELKPNSTKTACSIQVWAARTSPNYRHEMVAFIARDHILPGFSQPLRRSRSSSATSIYVVINDVVELPYRPDMGSEVNVLPASAIRDLEACGSPVDKVEMEMPVFLERVGGDLLAYKKCCDVNILLGTAAGPAHLRNVHCVIVEDDEDEFL
ncbi:hypothetical protein PF005_g7225 [Phytophthora fragariae]|uniref:Uncharacterized protein n=2 Tax=Phytophthora fragariae TaxID=53985 RepID=A0A6A3YL88_9STRA|nr:hypothetical protein PF005_g7225 [Phytophthora fragariae]